MNLLLETKLLPSWFKQDIPGTAVLEMQQKLAAHRVHTVCQEARCPNFARCFKDNAVTFMILGNTCSRNCRFCNVVKSEGRTLAIDRQEPYRISQLVQLFGLDYVVITSVCRDDLSDGGAEIFAQTINLIHRQNKDTRVEVLIPDFKGDHSSLSCVLAEKPVVAAHNIETVKRLYAHLRPKADYALSLQVLSRIKNFSSDIFTKSSIMLGLGEIEQEVVASMDDLRRSQCDMLTLGQYLPPSKRHYPVKEFVNIEQFQRYRQIGLEMGFKAVLSGPLVRSSYRAKETFKELI